MKVYIVNQIDMNSYSSYLDCIYAIFGTKEAAQACIDNKPASLLLDPLDKYSEVCLMSTIEEWDVS